jgi:hypothetical protein
VEKDIGGNKHKRYRMIIIAVELSLEIKWDWLIIIAVQRERAIHSE